MRSKRQQTAAKREREQAVREKRQRKVQKKLDRAAAAAEATDAPPTVAAPDGLELPDADAPTEAAAAS